MNSFLTPYSPRNLPLNEAKINYLYFEVSRNGCRISKLTVFDIWQIKQQNNFFRPARA